MNKENILGGVSIACCGLSVWAAWPMLTMSSYPHIPFRAYIGMLLMLCAHALTSYVRKLKSVHSGTIMHERKDGNNSTS